MNILIVDDIVENISLLQAMLEGAGYSVVSAQNGKEALKHLQGETFDLIISDILMPVMDGFQLCRECKNNRAWWDTPFVFYTATYTEEKDEEFAQSLGAQAYIIKPQEPGIFLKNIAQILEQPGLRAAPASQEGGLDNLNYLSEHNKRLVEKLENKMTQLEETHRSLQASEKKYRLLAENAQDVIFVLDQDLNYIYVSPSVKLLRGYEPDEVIGLPASATLTPASWELATSIVSEEMAREGQETADPQRSWTIELEMRCKNGTTVWTEVKVSLIRDEQNKLAGILGVTRDISDRKQAEDALTRSMANLRKGLSGTVQAIAKIVEARDPYTAGHELRVTHLACAVAEEMHFEQERIEGFRMAAMIHDIGKVAVPAEILSKPTKLTPTEFGLIKVHPQIGYDILKDIEFPWPVAQSVFQHHERMDGTGYPNGLKGADILPEARVIAVSDVVEAMASHRPYRPALGLNAALEEIENNKNTLYDADAADACLRLFREKGFQLEGI